jgi:unspecific monooxygenase
VAANIDMTATATTTTQFDFESTPAIPAKLETLPYLNAVIHESLRMRPTSTLLPRITPANRSVNVAGVEGTPPYTRINTFQWFIHRDPRRWERADEFVPERWLKSNDGTGKRNGGGEDVLWSFASGPRMCLGTNWTYYSKYALLPHS